MLEGTSGIKEEKDKVAKQIVSTSTCIVYFEPPLFKGVGGRVWHILHLLSFSTRFAAIKSPSPVDVNRQLHATEPKNT